MGRPKKNPNAANPPASKKNLLLPGSFDVNTGTDVFWGKLLRRFSKVARVYGFSRVETPLLEDSRLYQTFYDGEPDNLMAVEGGLVSATLRPSQLPGLIRNFCQSKLYETPALYKWHYSGFVGAKDPRGGIKADYEFGCEILGSFNHLTEAQTIAAAWEFFSDLGLEDVVLEINNLGSLECKQQYAESLVQALRQRRYDLCDGCNEHLEINPLQIWRCQSLDCQAVLAENGPAILDFLDQDAHKDFTCVLEALDEMGIPYQLNSFYMGKEGGIRTNFAIKCRNKDHTFILTEGGHHDAQMQKLCGKSSGAFGFSGSMQQLRQLMAEDGIELETKISSEVCLVPLGELAAKRSLRLFRDLTAERIAVYDHFGTSGVKNQLKIAQANQVPIALIMGQKEAMDEMVILRDVKSGMQEIISYDKIVEEVKKRLGK